MKPRASAKNRASAALAIAAAVLAGVSLFWTAQRVQTAESRLQHLQEAAAAEKQAIHVLRAEWDYLNRPERLEALARQHLNMTPPQPGNVVGSSAALAEPPPAPLVRKPAIRPQPAVLQAPVAAPAPFAPPQAVAPQPPDNTARGFQDLLRDLNPGRGRTP